MNTQIHEYTNTNVSHESSWWHVGLSLEFCWLKTAPTSLLLNQCLDRLIDKLLIILHEFFNLALWISHNVVSTNYRSKLSLTLNDRSAHNSYPFAINLKWGAVWGMKKVVYLSTSSHHMPQLIIVQTPNNLRDKNKDKMGITGFWDIGRYTDMRNIAWSLPSSH